MSAKQIEDGPRGGWVLYDGACGICSGWVPRWASTLSCLGLAVASLQSPWVAKRTGLPQDVLLTDIRLLQNDGSIVSGADVYRYVMRRVWWAYPIYLLSVTPVLKSAFDWGYRTFARHRMSISGSCGLPQ
jgi:predicted DCC family thiol-disulfide oxidoreductase YuxK